MDDAVVLDASAYDDDARAVLRLLFDGAGLVHRFDGSALHVATRDAQRAIDLAGELRPLGAPPPGPVRAGFPGPREVGGFEVASRSRRCLGQFVDWVLVGIVTGALASRMPDWSVTLVWIAWWVVPTTVTGRSIGKLVVRTRVARFNDPDRIPAFTAVLVRTLAKELPYLVVMATGFRITWTTPAWQTALAVTTGPWLLVILASVLVGRDGRGLHDLLARTVVLDARSTAVQAT